MVRVVAPSYGSIEATAVKPARSTRKIVVALGTMAICAVACMALLLSTTEDSAVMLAQEEAPHVSFPRPRWSAAPRAAFSRGA